MYHALGGCTLPREMRAGICNRFLCTGLRVLRDRYEQGGGPLRAFVMTAGTDAPRAAFVDRGEVRLVRRRLPVLDDPTLVTRPPAAGSSSRAPRLDFAAHPPHVP